MNADIGVIGAGIVGLSTAYALLSAGESVRVYERGLPGNAQSGGEARFFAMPTTTPGWWRSPGTAVLSGTSGRSGWAES